MVRYLMSLLTFFIMGTPNMGATGLECLELSALPYHTDIIEKLPLLFKLTLTNTCDHPVDTYYDAKGMLLLEKWTTVFATDQRGRSYKLSYFGGQVQGRRRMPIPTPLKPAQALERDCIRSVVLRRTPDPRWAGKLRDLLEFLPPGTYSGHVELPHLQGKRIVSNEFQFTVVKGEGVDAAAGERIRREHVDFFEGRDHPSDATFYDGRKWFGKVDVSRFGEIQKILDDFPDSPYAEWIRFWKLYHHGSEEDALEYSRTHADFPLSDNLMLRVAKRISNDDYRHERARQVLAEMQRLFPDGDTRARALQLQEKLTKKP